jgi:hypothetical protein
MKTVGSGKAFIWQPDGVSAADVGALRACVPVCELAAFESDLANLGRVYAAEHTNGELHHIPQLFFMEPANDTSLPL